MLALGAVARGELTEAEQTGRRIFLEGVGPDGRALVATTGDAGVALPPAFVACAQCHGRDGRGKTEAGVTTSDLRWASLVKPYAVTLSTGRSRPPYDETHFYDALTRGVDPAGRPLDPAMPRYQISETAAAELAAWLKQIAVAPADGVTADVIHLGFLISADLARTADAGNDRKVFNACCDDVNRAGGVYRRRLEVVAIESPAAIPAAHSLLALIAVDVSDTVLQACGSSHLPCLAAAAPAVAGPGRYGFFLYPGIVDRARLLIRSARIREPDLSRVALLYAEEGSTAATRAAVVAAVRSLVEVVPIAINHESPGDVMGAVDSARVQALLCLGPEGDFSKLFAASTQRSATLPQLWIEPPVHLPSSSVPAFAPRMGGPDDLPESITRDFRSWLTQHGIPEGDLARQMAIAATARTFLEALKQTGRALDREALVDTLELVREYQSGLTRPITFLRDRRIGLGGMYVMPLGVSPDVRTEWISLD